MSDIQNTFSISLGYGNGAQSISFPQEQLHSVLYPNSMDVTTQGIEEVERSLDAPIGTPPLEQIAKGKHKVAIVTSDMTRPMPSKLVLPCVLRRLYQAGVSKDAITVVIALGSHRPQTKAEMCTLLGEDIVKEIRCLNSCECEFVTLGTTRRGTPIELAKPVVEADLLICLGNIEYHYFAGYSGGAKAIMPGVSTRNAIQANHSRMMEPCAHAGKLSGNPVREDIEEAAARCGIDFILNVVLDEHKQIIRSVAGHWQQAHRVGCRYIDSLFRKTIDQKAEIVVVSQGGAPKDINLYQTQKALDNAVHAVADGGIIVLVGACTEGLGERVFQQWLEEAICPEDLIRRVKENFQLGGHKAAAIASVLTKARIFLVSQMDPDLVRSCFMEPYTSAQEALRAAVAAKGASARILVMPYGGSTLPYLNA